MGQGRPRPGLRSGLHPLRLEDGWLEESEGYVEAMAERRTILAGQRHLAVVEDTESRGAQEELRGLVAQHLAGRPRALGRRRGRYGSRAP